MSYNIDNCEYIKGGPLEIKRSVAKELQEKFGWDSGSGELPEDNLFDYLDLNIEKDPDEMLKIDRPAWTGSFSGNTYNVLQKEILPKTIGKATILFIWEGGDSKTALKVDDGKVTEKEVRITTDD